jgi:hypothetical protein
LPWRLWPDVRLERLPRIERDSQGPRVQWLKRRVGQPRQRTPRGTWVRLWLTPGTESGTEPVRLPGRPPRPPKRPRIPTSMERPPCPQQMVSCRQEPQELPRPTRSGFVPSVGGRRSTAEASIRKARGRLKAAGTLPGSLRMSPRRVAGPTRTLRVESARLSRPKSARLPPPWSAPTQGPLPSGRAQLAWPGRARARSCGDPRRRRLYLRRRFPPRRPYLQCLGLSWRRRR